MFYIDLYLATGILLVIIGVSISYIISKVTDELNRYQCWLGAIEKWVRVLDFIATGIMFIGLLMAISFI